MNSLRMNNCIAQKRKMLVGYLLAGYPDLEGFFEVLAASREGIDILEIGYPSQNPYADGSVIQEAHGRVCLESARSMDYWKRVRAATDSPIWIMAYRKDFVDSGAYLELAKAHVMDAVVLPDTDEDKLNCLAEELKPYRVDIVRIVNPEMDASQLTRRLQACQLVYEQLYVGKTGDSHHEEHYRDMLAFSKQFTNVTTFAGFGISTPEKVQEVLENGFDGAIIGTELIRRLNVSLDEFKSFITTVHQVI